jgi:hypothetical protein
MPLSKEAPALIRANLTELQKGSRVGLVVIGSLTGAQLDAINHERRAHGYPAIVAEVVFVGRHVYESRIVRDGYSIDGSARHPRPELFSIVPKGDRIKPKRPPTE